DSYRAAVFFFVSFAWIGLCHPQGTSLRFGPLAAAAYLGALAGHGHLSAVAAGSLAYALPGWVLTGEVVAWVATRLERAQSALAAREQSMRTLFAENPQPMWVYDRATLRFLEVNRAATERYGYTRDEFLAMAIAEIGATHDATATERDDASPSSTSTDRRRSTSARHLVANGTRIEVEVTSHALQFDGHDAVVVTVQDVTERKRLEDRLRHQAFHDALTGLPNRALFNERVEDALTRRDSRADSIAVAMIDLDGFKTVNDSLGHTIGDEILVIVARRLHDTLGPGDLPVRLGGDEFVVVLEQRDRAGTFEERLERVVDALRATFVLDGRSLELGASVGLATNQPGDGAEELLRNADMAMYVAKAAGKGCIRRFESEMHLAAVTRLELEADLRRAITANEFVVHYQPITLVPAQRTVGFEALVRWNHPRRGDRLISMQAVEVPEEGTSVDVPVTAEWGPGAYVTAALYRPMDVEAKRMPARALGLTWAKVAPGDRQLDVQLGLPDEMRPRGPMAIPVTLANLKPGASAYVTVAAVDVGILNLTNFKTPSPDDWYFGQRRLGTEIRDLYGLLIDRMQGVPGTIRSGGDSGATRLAAPPPTEKLVAFYSGVVKVDADGKATVSFDIPDFNGTIRVMAIAWSGDAVGHASKDVIVRDPVVIAASIPRFLLTGDSSRLLVEVNNVAGPAGEYQLKVEAGDGIGMAAADADRKIKLAEKQRLSFNIPIEGKKVGDFDVTV